MSDTSTHFRPGPLAIIGGLYMEFIILVFCGLVLAGTGKTKGPIYDVVGPDFLPTVVACMVAGLTLVQVVLQVVRQLRGDRGHVAAPLATGDIATGLVFGAATAAYVLVLALRVAPFYLSTMIFVTIATLLVARRFEWRDVAMGAVIGLLLGIFLQLIFTKVLVIDLPT